MNVSFKILKFNLFVTHFIPFVTDPARVIRFGLSPTQVTALSDFFTDFGPKYKTYTDPVLYGPVAISAINQAYIDGFKLTQGIRANIKSDTTITLTSEERAVCNIKKPDSNPTSPGIPKYSPSLVCISRTALTMAIVAINTSNPFKKGKDKGVDAIGVKMAIVGAGTVPQPADYVRLDDETSSEFDLLFTSGQVGKTAYIIGFYLNSHNEAGPDGLPLVITIA